MNAQRAEQLLEQTALAANAAIELAGNTQAQLDQQQATLLQQSQILQSLAVTQANIQPTLQQSSQVTGNCELRGFRLWFRLFSANAASPSNPSTRI